MPTKNDRGSSNPVAETLGSANCDAAELPRKVKELAIWLLTEGWEKGEDRRRWTVDVDDEAGKTVVTLTLAEAAEGTGLVVRH